MSAFRLVAFGVGCGLLAFGVGMIVAAVVYIFDVCWRQRRAEKQRTLRFIKENSHVHVSQR